MNKQEEIREGIAERVWGFKRSVCMLNLSNREWSSLPDGAEKRLSRAIAGEIMGYEDSRSVAIKDRSCGVSHQQGVWKKMFSVRSIIDGEVELFDGYGTKEDKNGDNEVP